MIAAFAAVAFLWWRLIDHLRLEWSINPQYAYGWAVPFLCVYIASRRAAEGSALRDEARARNTVDKSQERKPAMDDPSRPGYHLHVPRGIGYPLLAVLALTWLPTRLVQEANPEWRLISWALALEVIGLTLLMKHFLVGCIGRPGPRSAILSAGIFPICFMLVAVPWPSAIEEPLIQRLSRATAGLTSEALNVAGIPALQRGNVVEVDAGLIGIEDACCGIRSFQATLMLSLFFGGLYRLPIIRRLSLVLAGLVLAFGFNVVRTTLLGFVAAKQGLAAITPWHDPAGMLIPLGCFLVLALLARKENAADRSQNAEGTCEMPEVEGKRQDPPVRPRRPPWQPQLAGVSLLVWLVLAELATEVWYRRHESSLPAAVTWSIAIPADARAVEQRAPSPKAKQLLRFDAGQQASWQDAAGRQWQAIFLVWKAGRVAARLAKDHTPAVCLRAAGRSLLADTKEQAVTIGGLRMRVSSYLATDSDRGKVHVLYCLRQDQSLEESNLAAASIWQERVEPVLAGRRNNGQRSLEVAVWGIEDEAEASRALIEQMRKIVLIDDTINDS